MAVGRKSDCLHALMVGIAELDEVLWRASVSVMCGDEGSVKVGRAHTPHKKTYPVAEDVSPAPFDPYCVSKTQMDAFWPTCPLATDP